MLKPSVNHHFKLEHLHPNHYYAVVHPQNMPKTKAGKGRPKKRKQGSGFGGKKRIDEHIPDAQNLSSSLGGIANSPQQPTTINKTGSSKTHTKETNAT